MANLTSDLILDGPTDSESHGDRVGARSLRNDLTYLLAGFLQSLISFVLLLVGVSLAAGTAVIGVGVVIGAVTLLLAGLLADVDRRLIRIWHVGERSAPTRPPADLTLAAGAVLERQGWTTRRVLGTYASAQRWRDLIFGLVLSFPIRLTGFVLSVTWLAAAFGGMSYLFWGLAMPPDNASLLDLLAPHLPVGLIGQGHLGESAVSFLVGGLMLLSAPAVIGGWARLDTAVAQSFLGLPAGGEWHHD